MLTGTYDSIGRDTIREMLRRQGTIDIIRAKANSFSEAARKNLDVLAKTEYRVALEEIPGFVIDRNS
jgi:geranylgeranyl pyrophosphate synthase